MKIRLFVDDEKSDLRGRDRAIAEDLMQALSSKFWDLLDEATQTQLEGCTAELAGHPGHLILNIECPDPQMFLRLNHHWEWIPIVDRSISRLVDHVQLVSVHCCEADWIFFRRLKQQEPPSRKAV